ncbi:MAG: hypothetical protein IT366_24490 [Candidatus Hydrogenedentes bacterium]|nr:hypothetical protein [Candidatus Hydrogenedentota bacterium]
MIFTPRLGESEDTRVTMSLSPEDLAKIKRGQGWTAKVTDRSTGKRYQVESAPCGLGCHCDAIAREIVE